MKKVLYSAMYGGDAYPFGGLAATVKTARKPDDITEPDSILVVWGGADINPALYGHSIGKYTGHGGQRDYVEWALMRQALSMGIPIIGVCRGAQMLCALAGGYLYQHVHNHAGYGHSVTTYDGKQFAVNSIHHQMMAIPNTVEHELLGWSTTRRSDEYYLGDDTLAPPPEKEPEFVFFPKVQGYAIQWHPEGMDDESEATQYIFKEIYARDKQACTC
jgi:putative glutamine amidotransferase